MKDFKNYLRRRIDKDNTFEEILELTKIFYRKYVRNEKNVKIDDSSSAIYQSFSEKYLS